MKKTIKIILTILLLFIVAFYLFVLIDKNIEDSVPKNQEEYENMIYEKCKSWDDREEVIGSCIWATVLNDGMSDGPIRQYSKNTQYSVNVRNAENLSDDVLLKELRSGLEQLYNMEHYETELGFQMAAYMQEFYTRELKDSVIDKLFSLVLNKYGVCWGNPDEQCIE